MVRFKWVSEKVMHRGKKKRKNREKKNLRKRTMEHIDKNNGLYDRWIEQNCKKHCTGYVSNQGDST